MDRKSAEEFSRKDYRGLSVLSQDAEWHERQIKVGALQRIANALEGIEMTLNRLEILVNERG